MSLEIVQKDSAHYDAVETQILAVLDEHADAAGHPFIVEKLAFEAVEDGTVIGGISARITQDWMYISLLGVRSDIRSTGVGSRLIQAAEQAARARNLTGMWLDTFTFQAPGFYEKMGFECFGQISDSPKDHARMFFSKRFA